MSTGTYLRQVLRTVTSVRSAGHDLDTEDGRSAERYRRAALASWVNIASRVIYIGVLFVAIRIVADSTSSEELGLWLLLVGAVALVGFADLGIGNGLLNVIADADGRDDKDLIREAVSSAFVALTALAGVLVVGGMLVIPHVPWNTFLNVSGLTSAQTAATVTAFVACTAVTLPVSISQRVRHAHQDGWVANLWLAVGSLISLALIVATDIADSSIATRVAAMLIGPPIAFLIDSVILFGFTRRDLCPRPVSVTLSAMSRVLRQGSMFFVLATVAAVSYEADSLIISHYLGADQVALYAIPFRLFALAPSLVLVIVSPLWPAHGEAISRGDLSWVHRTIRRTIVIGAVLTGPISIVLVVLAPWIISIWVGDDIDPPISVLIGIAVWAIINGVSTALAMFFNGAGILRLQVAVAVGMGVANVLLSIVLVQHIGIAGPIWGTVTTQILFGLVPAWIVLRKFLGRHSDPSHLTAFLRRWSDIERPEPLSDGVTP